MPRSFFYDERRGQLIVLYGRRRVGKTETLKEFCKDKMAKLTPLKETAKFYYALFSESGFDDKIIAEAEKENNLQIYDLQKIVNYK